MFKTYRQAVLTPKQTKHEHEMEILRAHHARVMNDGALREATLVGSGVFQRTTDGKLTVAKPYANVIVSKIAA